MSRQNKVNPGQYTQRGRLAQDDMARELKVQDASISSQKSWQPASDRQTPWPEATSGDAEAEDSPASQTNEAAEAPRETTASQLGLRPRPVPSAKASSKAKAGSKAKAPRVARKAVLARSAGKGSALLKAGRTKKKAGTTAKRKR